MLKKCMHTYVHGTVIHGSQCKRGRKLIYRDNTRKNSRLEKDRRYSDTGKSKVTTFNPTKSVLRFSKVKERFSVNKRKEKITHRSVQFV
jgi:hypothetical protein